jgi:DNA polymerase III subunit gamma/tau
LSYLVLARKYRPQTFEELVGQEHVSTTLIHALESKRLAHAYIFSGPRGCGKTTTARIVAKALNCAKGPTPKPCGECAQCKEIATGASPDDVLEIDGASNRGIDQIRELRDTVKYSPARSRYRIYIIDEAHQITDAGFNALLKTLEEPPAHAVFMMATTEAQKVPATILSRCQRFQLKSIPPPEIVRQLEKILKLEKIAADAEALAEVARAANGSLRDALSLLDQVIAFSPKGMKAESVRSLLGLLPQETVRRFARVIEDGEPEKVMQAVQKAVEDGFDLFQLAHDLTEHWHALFLLKNGVDPQIADAAGARKEAERLTLPRLERWLAASSRCAEQMRRSESPRVTFELACLEMAKKGLSVDEILERLESMEKSLADGGPAAVKKKFSDGEIERTRDGETKSSPSASQLAAAGLAPIAPKPAPAKAAPLSAFIVDSTPSHTLRQTGAAAGADGKQGPDPAAGRPDASVPLRPDQVRTAWTRMLEEIGARKPSLETFLLSARWEVHAGNVLAINTVQDFQRQQILSNVELVRELLAKNLAAQFTIQCALDSRAAPAAAPPAPPAPPAPEDDAPVEESSGDEEPAAEPPPPEPFENADNGLAEPAGEILELDPGVKKLFDKFPGKIKKIEPRT